MSQCHNRCHVSWIISCKSGEKVNEFFEFAECFIRRATCELLLSETNPGDSLSHFHLQTVDPNNLYSEIKGFVWLLRLSPIHINITSSTTPKIETVRDSFPYGTSFSFSLILVRYVIKFFLFLEILKIVFALWDTYYYEYIKLSFLA